MAKTKIVRGNHFDGIGPGTCELKFIGGLDRIQEIREVLEAVEQELSPCPFCGGPTVLDGRFLYATPAVVARCRSCRCSTPSLPEGMELSTYRLWTLEERAREAVGIWNRRATA